MSTFYDATLACPACFQDLALALVENADPRLPVRSPLDGDQTVCSHCTTFLRYREVVNLERTRMGLTVIDHDAYEELPEKHQAELMQVRNKLISLRAQGTERQTAIMAAMAQEIATLKLRVDNLRCSGCTGQA